MLQENKKKAGGSDTSQKLADKLYPTLPLYYDDKNLDNLLNQSVQQADHAVAVFNSYESIEDILANYKNVDAEKVEKLPFQFPMNTDRQDMFTMDDAYMPRPHVNESDNTRIDRVDRKQTMPDLFDINRAKSPSKHPTVKSFKDGVGVALDQINYSFEYMLKSAEKKFTPSISKQLQLDREMNEIAMRYARLPQTEGMAAVGSVGTNIVAIGLPSYLGGLIGGPYVSAGVLGIATTMDIAVSGAQASMEVDAYEQINGLKVDPMSRNAYIISVMATNAIMDVMMGSKVAKGFTPGMVDEISGSIKSQIFNNPVAQKEFNKMTQQVLKREKQHLIDNVPGEVIKSGVETGVTTAALEAERSIYTHDAPELSRIVDSALSGTIMGATYGGATSVLPHKVTHNRRKNQDEVYYASDKGTLEHGLPISEIRDMEIIYDEEGVPASVSGIVASPGERQGERVTVPIENVAGGSYKKAMEDKTITQNNNEYLDIPQEKMDKYKAEWERALSLKKTKPEEAYNIQNEVLQNMAADMGCPIKVFKHNDDLPAIVKAQPSINKGYAFTIENQDSYFVLDRLDNFDIEKIPALIRHEVLGHRVMRDMYGNIDNYNRDMGEAFYDVATTDERYKDHPNIIHALENHWNNPEHKRFNAWVETGEEKAALLTEPRDYVKDMPVPPGYEQMYKMLLHGEEMVRLSTANELRKYYQMRKGNPMPTLYEIEASRAKKGDNKK